MFKRTMIATLVATATVLSAGVASASPVTVTLHNTSESFGIKYASVFDGVNLNATVTFQLTQPLTATNALLGVKIVNNSFGLGNNRLTAFGIDTVAPTLTTISDNSAEWAGFLGLTFSGGFQKVDLCAASGGQNCTGGAGGGVAEGGGTKSFVLDLTTSGNFLTSFISFTSPYAVKFQSVGSGSKSVEFAGCLTTDKSCVSTPPQEFNVPEPTSLALVGITLFGAATATRRRKA